MNSNDEPALEPFAYEFADFGDRAFARIADAFLMTLLGTVMMLVGSVLLALGGAGYDQIYGGAGDDTLDGGNGTDHLDGGSDNDSCCRGETTTSCETQTRL